MNFNINELTLGELNKIKAELDTLFPEKSSCERVGDKKSLNENSGGGVVGKYCIVRCRDAGVHAGEVEFYKERVVSLKGSRRLWFWKCIKEHSLSGVARHGIHSDSKISGEVNIVLTDSCEIIPCSNVSAETIKNAAIYNPK